MCVRGAQSEESRVQHHQPTSSARRIQQQQSNPCNQVTDYQAQILALKDDQVASAGLASASSTITTALSSSHMTTSSAAMTNSNGSQNTENLTNGSGLPAVRGPTVTVVGVGHQNHPQNQHLNAQSNYVDNMNNNPIQKNNFVNTTTEAQMIEHDQAGVEQDLTDKLVKETSDEARLELLISLRNLITACNKKKDSLINSRNFSKMVELLSDYESSTEVKTQLVLLICALAKGGETNILKLNEHSIDQKIYDLATEYCSEHQEYYDDQSTDSTSDHELIEACLRCLRSIMAWPNVSRSWLLYETRSKIPSKITKPAIIGVDNMRLKNLNNIIVYALDSDSYIIQECVANLFATTCDRGKDQNLLYKASAVTCIAKIIESNSERVIRASLSWLSQLCFRNPYISNQVTTTSCSSGLHLLDRLIYLMSKDMHPEIQLLAAKSFAHIYRAANSPILKNDSRVTTHVLPTLVRLVHRDQPAHLRSKSAECIAFLIEDDKRLQSTASICDHLIESLASMLEYKEDYSLTELASDPDYHKSTKVSQEFGVWHNQYPPQIDNSVLSSLESHQTVQTTGCEHDLENNMKRASFLALASLAANLESIRKKISNTSPIVQQLIKSLIESHPGRIKAVLKCILSLSRSVKQLRTSFAENSIYNSLRGLLYSSFDDTSTHSKDILILVIAILCNITLNFSPGKQHFIDFKTVDIFCKLTKRPERTLRLHSLWILMNLVYEVEETNLRMQVLQALDMPYILLLLQSDEEDEVIIKTLGFLRNLMSRPQQVDSIMKLNGEAIIRTLAELLNKHHPYVIEEQAMCVLANIADGAESKNYIMANELVIHHIGEMLADLRVGDARLAALDCVRNLVQKEYEGSSVRRDELKRRGFNEKLKFLLHSEDLALVNRAQKAYNLFAGGLDDRCL